MLYNKTFYVNKEVQKMPSTESTKSILDMLYNKTLHGELYWTYEVTSAGYIKYMADIESSNDTNVTAIIICNPKCITTKELRLYLQIGDGTIHIKFDVDKKDRDISRDIFITLSLLLRSVIDSIHWRSKEIINDIIKNANNEKNG